MQDIFLSIERNILKVSTVNDTGFVGVSAEVDEKVCSDGSILDAKEFSSIVNQLIPDITKVAKRNLCLNFVLGPQDTFLHFATVNKQEGDTEGQILKDVEHKLEGVSLEELNFTYQKIAPFVYQFSGYRKVDLEKLIEVSNNLGIVLKSAIPWTFLLPKFVNAKEPVIFISRTDTRQVVILSEMGGVFYTGVFEKDQSTEVLKKLIQELSIYKRKTPINKIYTFNYGVFVLGESYDLTPLEVPTEGLTGTAGYETHILAKYMLDFGPNITSGQANFLNLLPLPVVEKKPSALVAVGASALSLFLVAGAVVGIYFLKNKNNTPPSTQLAEIPNNTGAVLSEIKETTESSVSETPTLDLKKADLTMRIENAAGISGVAGRAKDYLEKLDYRVLSIGNADVTGQKETILRFKRDKSAYSELLKYDMKDKYKTLVIKDDLPSTAEYDVLISIGTDINE